MDKKKIIEGLREMQGYCHEQTDCGGCELHGLCDMVTEEPSPNDWELPEED